MCYGLCVCVCMCVLVCVGSHSGGQSCLADRDSKNSHQPAETASRFLSIYLSIYLSAIYITKTLFFEIPNFIEFNSDQVNTEL